MVPPDVRCTATQVPQSCQARLAIADGPPTNPSHGLIGGSPRTSSTFGVRSAARIRATTVSSSTSNWRLNRSRSPWCAGLPTSANRPLWSAIVGQVSAKLSHSRCRPNGLPLVSALPPSTSSGFGKVLSDLHDGPCLAQWASIDRALAENRSSPPVTTTRTQSPRRARTRGAGGATSTGGGGGTGGAGSAGSGAGRMMGATTSGSGSGCTNGLGDGARGGGDGAS